MTKGIALFKDQRISLLLLLGLALLINFLLFFKFGIKFVNDSPRYVSYAEGIKEGVWYQPHNFWYIGYILFIVVLNFFSESLSLVVLCQVLLHLLAIVSLYHTAIRLFKDQLAAFFSGLSYLLFFEIPIWNFYILAESIYGSFICFTLYFIVKAQEKPKYWLAACLFITYTFFIKPTGIALLFALGIYGIIYFRDFFFKHKTVLLSLVPLGAVVLYFLLNSMLSTFADSILANDYANGEIIYGIASLKGNPHIDALTVGHEGDLTFPAKDQPPLLRLFLFFVYNPLYYLKLCLAKVFFHLSHLRPYHSLLHNLFSALYLYPLYALFLFTIAKIPFAKALKGLFISFLACHTAIVMITTVDWDGRFMVPMLPVIFLVASPALAQLSRQLMKRSRAMHTA